MSQEVRLEKERTKALAQITARCLYYKKRGFMLSLVEAVLLKKSEYLKEAKTIAEIRQIAKPCAPIKVGNRFCDPPYYVPEEELIQWSMASLKAPLNADASKRYQQVFESKFPDSNIFR